MALWDNDSKPNWLSEQEKARCYCDERGWVLVHLNGREEVLVAASSLNDPNDVPVQDAIQRAAAVAAKDAQIADNDGDGVLAYQDADDNDSTNS